MSHITYFFRAQQLRQPVNGLQREIYNELADKMHYQVEHIDVFWLKLEQFIQRANAAHPRCRPVRLMPLYQYTNGNFWLDLTGMGRCELVPIRGCFTWQGFATRYHARFKQGQKGGVAS